MAVEMCENCGLPTITDIKKTYCDKCHKLLCVTCQDFYDGSCCKNPNLRHEAGKAEHGAFV